MNVFDILGPVMIGPSSSHTAGAARIGLVTRALLGKTPVKAHIFLHGSFAKTYKGHGTDKSLVAGILGMLTDDERIRWKAFCGARLQGLVPGTLSLTEYMDKVDAAADADCQALEAGQMTEERFEARQQILDDLYNLWEFVGAAAQDIDGGAK